MLLKRLVVVFAAVTAIAGLVAPAGASTMLQTDPAAAGEWSAPFSEDGLFDDAPPATKAESALLPTAVSIAVLPDGNLVYWNGLEGSESAERPIATDMPDPEESRARILDLRGFVTGEAGSPTWWVPNPEVGVGGDMFCADLRHLADGRVMVVGGTDWNNEDESLGLPQGIGRLELHGRDNARIFDPESSTWTEIDPMAHRRWYPSLVTLPDNRLFVAGGVRQLIYNTSGTNVAETEIFDPATGEWAETGASGSTSLPLFARLHLLPNGKVFYDATGQMWSPAGQAVDEAQWNFQKWYDPASNSWENLGLAPFGARSGSFSAMLPLKAPYDEANILIAGGTLGTSPGSYVANDITEFLTVNDEGVASREQIASLNNRRWYSSGVVLPSGEVIALSGADRDEVIFPGVESAVRQAEMWDGDEWLPLATGTRQRTYHNTAVLLGDGSILVGGHSPIPAGYGPGNENYAPGLLANNFKDPSFEIFKPPYLFRGPRPRLVEVQSGIALGETFKITSPDAKRIESVVLSRLPAITHLADADQRTVEIPFKGHSSGNLYATAPGDPNVLVPGYYYLFLMADNGQGLTPSRAAIVRIGETDKSAAVLPFGS